MVPGNTIVILLHNLLGEKQIRKKIIIFFFTKIYQTPCEIHKWKLE